MANTLSLALDYLKSNPGHFLFPIKAGAKTPPMIQDNLNAATDDPAQIEAWHRKWPGCNWGLALAKSNMVVVDVDLKKGKVGAETYALLEMLHGWPPTKMVMTPSNGHHYYYRGKHVFALGIHGFGKDIDSPNYVLIPGCHTADGRGYRVWNNQPIVDAPEWFFTDYLKPHDKTSAGEVAEPAVDLDQDANVKWAIDYLIHDAPEAIEGQGGELTTLKVAMALRDHGVSRETAKNLMQDHYNQFPTCDPLWEVNELEKKIDNAYDYASINAPGESTAEADFADDPPEPIPVSPEVAKQVADRKKLAERPVDQRERRWTFPELCEEWVYISALDRFVNRADPEFMLKTEVFDKRFDYAKPGKATKVSKAMFKLAMKTIRRPDHPVFLPGRGEFLNGGRDYNLYKPSNVVAAQGDLTTWGSHLDYLFPDPVDRSHVENWCAWLLQNISAKPKHALLIAGHVQGTGKSFIAEVLTRIIGERNVSPVGSVELSSSFNKWALGSKLLLIEELRALDKRDVAHKLHPIITQIPIPINDKGVSTYVVHNCFGVMAMTNDDAAIPLDNTDRRYLVVRTHALPRDDAYYSALYAKLEDPAFVAAVAWELMHRDLKGYTAQGRAPETTAKTEMIEAGLSDLEHWLMEHAGEPPLNGRIVCIDDVISVLPKRLERTPRLGNAIASVLKYKFKGVRLGQHKLSSGSRLSLWGINGSAVSRLDMQAGTIGALYERERAQTGSAKENSAASDFAD